LAAWPRCYRTNCTLTCIDLLKTIKHNVCQHNLSLFSMT
jgi:hypothetical protein